MGWPSRIKKVLGFAPLLTIFGVPGAGLIVAAVDQIIADPHRPNEDAVSLTAAAVDDLNRRLSIVEKRLGVDRSKDPLKR